MYPPHHLTVTRTARYFVLGDPDATDEIWFVLHGYSQLAASFLRWFAPASRPGRLIVAPEALSRSYYDETSARRVGASWMTKEDREAEIEDYVRYLDQLADHLIGDIPPRPRLEVHGFSQGAATACRWAAFGRNPPARLVLWGGTVPPDLDLELLRDALRGMPLTIAIGDTDQYLADDAVRHELARLAAGGLDVVMKRFAGGHTVDRTTLTELA